MKATLLRFEDGFIALYKTNKIFEVTFALLALASMAIVPLCFAIESSHSIHHLLSWRVILGSVLAVYFVFYAFELLFRSHKYNSSN